MSEHPCHCCTKAPSSYVFDCPACLERFHADEETVIRWAYDHPPDLRVEIFPGGVHPESPPGAMHTGGDKVWIYGEGRWIRSPVDGRGLHVVRKLLGLA